MTVIGNEVEYVSAADAAAHLSTTETRILMLLKQKVLAGTMADEGWLVTRASLLGYDGQKDEPEAQPACRTSCSSSRCGCH